MRDMKNKSTMLSVRLDADLLAALNDLARRLGDDNTSAAARWAIRTGLAADDTKRFPLITLEQEVLHDVGQD
jgi:metal-responsive CopG/Arc/MetJ family transcriptional regulator